MINFDLFNCAFFLPDDSLAGLIILHGLGISMGSDELCGSYLKLRLKLSSKTIVKCPKAERKPVDILPPTMVPGMQFARSWFNFWMMPYESVLSPVATESKEDLDGALELVENDIRDLISKGVPSRNIVVSGLSQGGALTLYTALHTKYKLGGFVPIVTWLPLRKSEPIESIPTPVNKDTPIFHMNGMMDPIVTEVCGRKTKEEMNKVFTRYTLKNIPLTTHTTTVNPVTIPILRMWLKNNTSLKFKSSSDSNLLEGIFG